MKQLNNRDDVGLVPKLRFPEFWDSGEWEGKRLVTDCLATIIKETVSRKHLNLDTYISTDNFLPNYGGIKKADRLPPSGSFTQYKKGDILVSNIRPYLKKVWIANKLGACSNDVIVFRAKEKCEEIFLAYILKNDDFINYVMQGAKGVKMPRGDITSMKYYPTSLPNKKEQKKIADCLSSLDDLITAENKKLNALKTHKKGLMQNLFPAEGKTVPEWRFPEFRDSGKWELSPIGDKIDLLSGYPFKGDEISQNSTGIPLMRGINITEGFIRHNQDIDRYFLKKISNYEKYKLKTNDLVIGMDGSKVGKNSALITNKDNDALLVQRVARLRAHSVATIFFVFHCVNSSKFHVYVDKINTSSGIPHISAQQINDFTIPFPKNEKEQKKIGDCLSELDNRISAQLEKIEALKLHKKGLMQGLFPSFKVVGE